MNFSPSLVIFCFLLYSWDSNTHELLQQSAKVYCHVTSAFVEILQKLEARKSSGKPSPNILENLHPLLKGWCLCFTGHDM